MIQHNRTVRCHPFKTHYPELVKGLEFDHVKRLFFYIVEDIRNLVPEEDQHLVEKVLTYINSKQRELIVKDGIPVLCMELESSLARQFNLWKKGKEELQSVPLTEQFRSFPVFSAYSALFNIVIAWWRGPTTREGVGVAGEAIGYAVSAKANKINEYAVISNSFSSTCSVKLPDYEFEGRVLYIIDSLEEKLTIEHEGKIFLDMPGIVHCPEYGYGSMDELLTNLFESDSIFWSFARNWIDNLTC